MQIKLEQSCPCFDSVFPPKKINNSDADGDHILHHIFIGSKVNNIQKQQYNISNTTSINIPKFRPYAQTSFPEGYESYEPPWNDHARYADARLPRHSNTSSGRA